MINIIYMKYLCSFINKKINAAIILVLVITLLLPALSWSFEAFVTTVGPTLATRLLPHNQLLTLSPKLGQIIQSRSGSQKTIVVIQDLHCHSQVQENISHIIAQLRTQHDLQLVGQEGAWGRVDTSILGQLPLPKLKEKLSNYFLNQGMLTGAELYDIHSPGQIQLMGLENQSLYERSHHLLQAFFNSDSLGIIHDLNELVKHAPNPPSTSLTTALPIIERLLNICATSQDIAYFHTHRQAFYPTALYQQLDRLGSMTHDFLFEDLLKLTSYLEQAERFYELTDQRSEAFVTLMLAAMSEQNQDLGVIVTGGYHSEKIITALHQRNIGYALIRPHHDSQSIVNPYFDLLQHEQTPLEKLLAKNQIHLALRSRFTRRESTLFFQLISSVLIRRLLGDKQLNAGQADALKQFLATHHLVSLNKIKDTSFPAWPSLAETKYFSATTGDRASPVYVMHMKYPQVSDEVKAAMAATDWLSLDDDQIIIFSNYQTMAQAVRTLPSLLMPADDIQDKEDQRLMQQALAQARLAANERPFLSARIGTVIVENGQISGRGYNRVQASAHAEHWAILDMLHAKLNASTLLKQDKDRLGRLLDQVEQRARLPRYPTYHQDMIQDFSQVDEALGHPLHEMTFYVTYETCNNCSRMLAALNPRRVVLGAPASNPNYHGLTYLRQAGIEIKEGVLTTEARAISIGYLIAARHFPKLYSLSQEAARYIDHLLRSRPTESLRFDLRLITSKQTLTYVGLALFALYAGSLLAYENSLTSFQLTTPIWSAMLGTVITSLHNHRLAKRTAAVWWSVLRSIQPSKSEATSSPRFFATTNDEDFRQYLIAYFTTNMGRLSEKSYAAAEIETMADQLLPTFTPVNKYWLLRYPHILQPVFLEVLSEEKGHLGRLRVEEKKKLKALRMTMPTGETVSGQAMLRRVSGFRVPLDSALSRLQAGKTIMAAMADKPGSNYIDHLYSFGRQPILGLDDGTFLGLKGAGQSSALRSDGYDSETNKHGLLDKDELQPAINASRQLKKAFIAAKHYFFPFPQLVAYRKLNSVPTSQSYHIFPSNKNLGDYDHYITFYRFAHPFRFNRLLAWLQGDEGLFKLRQDLVRTLSVLAPTVAKQSLTYRDLLEFCYFHLGLAAATISNRNLKYKTFHLQDIGLGMLSDIGELYRNIKTLSDSEWYTNLETLPYKMVIGESMRSLTYLSQHSKDDSGHLSQPTNHIPATNLAVTAFANGFFGNLTPRVRKKFLKDNFGKTILTELRDNYGPLIDPSFMDILDQAIDSFLSSSTHQPIHFAWSDQEMESHVISGGISDRLRLIWNWTAGRVAAIFGKAIVPLTLSQYRPRADIYENIMVLLFGSMLSLLFLLGPPLMGQGLLVTPDEVLRWGFTFSWLTFLGLHLGGHTRDQDRLYATALTVVNIILLQLPQSWPYLLAAIAAGLINHHLVNRGLTPTLSRWANLSQPNVLPAQVLDKLKARRR